MLEIIDRGIISRRSGIGAYMPVITPLPGGSFIAAQHVGQELGSPDNHVEVLRSPDGKTWDNCGSIHTPDHDLDAWTYRAPSISTTPEGRMLMTASRFEKKERLFDLDTEDAARCELVLLWSDDGGATWSTPQIVPVPLPSERYTWNGAGSLLQITDDRWMYPLETWKPEGHIGPPDQKAAALFSSDRGQTWGEFTIVADDPAGKILWWDQMCALLPDGRIYTLIWTHLYGTSRDLANHWTVSEDQGRTWTRPRPTNLQGQVCTPIPLPDGRIAAVYNFRHDPQGIRLAISDDMERFDVANEAVVFDAGAEATLGDPGAENFLAEHMQIAFGKPGGVLLQDGTIMSYFWCTVDGVTHTRWAQVRVD